MSETISMNFPFAVDLSVHIKRHRHTSTNTGLISFWYAPYKEAFYSPMTFTCHVIYYLKDVKIFLEPMGLPFIFVVRPTVTRNTRQQASHLDGLYYRERSKQVMSDPLSVTYGTVKIHARPKGRYFCTFSTLSVNILKNDLNKQWLLCGSLKMVTYMLICIKI